MTVGPRGRGIGDSEQVRVRGSVPGDAPRPPLGGLPPALEKWVQGLGSCPAEKDTENQI